MGQDLGSIVINVKTGTMPLDSGRQHSRHNRLGNVYCLKREELQWKGWEGRAKSLPLTTWTVSGFKSLPSQLIVILLDYSTGTNNITPIIINNINPHYLSYYPHVHFIRYLINKSIFSYSELTIQIV